MKYRSCNSVLGIATLALVLLTTFAPTALATAQTGVGSVIKSQNSQLERNSSFFSFYAGWLAMGGCWGRGLLMLWFVGLLMATIMFK